MLPLSNIVEVVTKNNEEKTNEIDNDLNYKFL
jgi:hypothetical protein